MKAITVRIPWPWAICYLGKPVENRVWAPSAEQLFPGDFLAIHCGKAVPPTEILEAFHSMQEMGVVDDAKALPTFSELLTQESSIVAVVTYAGTVTKHSSPWFVGPKALTWSKMTVMPKPVKCRGAQGLWDVPPDVLAAMRAQFSTPEERG